MVAQQSRREQRPGRARRALRRDRAGRAGLAKCVPVRPSSCALSFIRRRTSASSPARCSASAVAASLAEAIATPSSRTCSGTCWPVAQAHAIARGARRVVADGHRLVHVGAAGLERLAGQVERHQLDQAGRRPLEPRGSWRTRCGLRDRARSTDSALSAGGRGDVWRDGGSRERQEHDDEREQQARRVHFVHSSERPERAARQKAQRTARLSSLEGLKRGCASADGRRMPRAWIANRARAGAARRRRCRNRPGSPARPAQRGAHRGEHRAQRAIAGGPRPAGGLRHAGDQIRRESRYIPKTTRASSITASVMAG